MNIITRMACVIGLGIGVAEGADLRPPAPRQTSWKFDFGSGPIAPGFTPVSPDMVYSGERGHGFDRNSQVRAEDRGGPDEVHRDFCTGDRPFFFSVALPEGNYTVTVTMGDPVGATTNTVKAESRRLMLEDVRTAAGRFDRRAFTVNVRTPEITGGGQVRLKEREKNYLHWDDKLTLEFNGTRPCVAAVEIRKTDDAVTVYLLGDSTVTDQPKEPWNSWGQMLPRFFSPGVAVANHAESGESLRSSLGARRVDKVFSTTKTGDYLLVQFGHNDMKDRSPDALAVYKSNLEALVMRARGRGATPVLVTSMERKAGVARDTLQGYPQTVRDVAAEMNVPLIDLHAMSKRLYVALGPELDQAFQDGTHHNSYGSYELARCVVEGIRASKLILTQFLADDVSPFDPGTPDPPSLFAVPASPQSTSLIPDGN